jgi:hypothetical protein
LSSNICLSNKLQRLSLLLVAAAAICMADTACGSHYDVSYNAGTGAVAQSPWYDGWSPSWQENPAGDPLAYSVTGAAGGGATAWQINDNGQTPIAPNYIAGFFAGHDYDAAKANGWSLRTNAQFVSGAANAPTHGLYAYFDDTIYQFLVNKTTTGTLQAFVHTSLTTYTPVPLASGGAANAYHHYELRYDPATAEVDFTFDGALIRRWAGVVVPNPIPNHGNVFRFGSINDAGFGVMNYRTADFETLDPAPSPTEQGDFNNDGMVSLADYAVWREQFGSTSNLTADANGNRRIDAGDYTTWKRNFGRDLAAADAIAYDQPIPEPTTAILLAMGVLVVCSTGRW